MRKLITTLLTMCALSFVYGQYAPENDLYLSKEEVLYKIASEGIPAGVSYKKNGNAEIKALQKEFGMFTYHFTAKNKCNTVVFVPNNNAIALQLRIKYDSLFTHRGKGKWSYFVKNKTAMLQIISLYQTGERKGYSKFGFVFTY